jgi:hypothetical protein
MENASARADTLDDIEKKGEMVVGMEAAYVPSAFFKDSKIERLTKIANEVLGETNASGALSKLRAREFRRRVQSRNFG